MLTPPVPIPERWCPWLCVFLAAGRLMGSLLSPRIRVAVVILRAALFLLFVRST